MPLALSGQDVIAHSRAPLRRARTPPTNVVNVRTRSRGGVHHVRGLLASRVSPGPDRRTRRGSGSHEDATPRRFHLMMHIGAVWLLHRCPVIPSGEYIGFPVRYAIKMCSHALTRGLDSNSALVGPTCERRASNSMFNLFGKLSLFDNQSAAPMPQIHFTSAIFRYGSGARTEEEG